MIFDKKNSRLFVVLCIAIFLVIYGAFFYKYYFSREYLPGHDYNVTFVSPHIVMNYLINGHIPLWAPEMNCGAPVWPDTEVFPGYDPVALIVNFIYGLQGDTSVYSHVLTIFIWHCIFAVGGFLLFRILGLSRTSSLFGFMVLLFSSLTVLNFRQADDYVTLYRYVPLLFYAIVRFFKKPGFSNSVLLGLIAGLSIAGYQTPNIIILIIFALLASIPLFKKMDMNKFVRMTPAFITAILIGMPFVAATMNWIKSEAVCREAFTWGYRGGLSDVFGPLIKLYHNETLIYIGLLPFLFALLGVFKLVKKRFEGIKEEYWPDYFVMVFGILVWVFYIGFPENFTGLDKPFFNIRSFNNMLPFLLLVLVYFSCRYLNGIESDIGDSRGMSFSGFIKNPIIILIMIGVGITLFVELSRPGIFSVGFNRYDMTGQRPDGGFYLIEYPFYSRHLSAKHIYIFLNLFIPIIMLFIAVSMRYKRVLIFAVFLMAIIDLCIIDTMLFSLSYYAQLNPKQRKEAEFKPVLNAPFPARPPEHREREMFGYEKNPWCHQGSVTYHRFAAKSPIRTSWFFTKDFYEFYSLIKPEERFDRLTGVTGPLIYFVNKVVPQDKDKILESLINMPEDELGSAIVVDKMEFSDQMPVELPAGNSGSFEISSYGPNHIEMKTNTSGDLYLVYLDSYSKDWQGYIDNKRVPVIRANYIFKAVLVPQGEHNVRFIYRPYLYLAAFWARIFGITFAVAVLGTGYMKQRAQRLIYYEQGSFK